MRGSKNRLQETLDKVFEARLERREFMRRLGLTAVALAGLPHVGRYAWAQEQTPEQAASQIIRGKNDMLIVHNDQTGVLETPLELLRDERVTPKDILFVRNNQILEPEGRTLDGVPPEDWRVEFDGLIQFTRDVPVADLANMEQREVEMVLQCSGNGRSFYARAVQARGSQWQHGGMGNVVFRGVPLGALLESFDPPLNIHPEARFLTLEGADPPTGTAADFEHSVPLDYALEHAILATHMNGEPIPGAHGGPVRFIIPGYYGTMNMKWLTRIRFDALETNNNNQIPRYRTPNVPIEPGTDITYTFENSTPCWNQEIKSVIFAPLDGENVPAGQLEVRGVAWNDGVVPIQTVQVSTDGGETWRNAELETPATPYAWYHWRAMVDLGSGEQRIWSRAVDVTGNAQPLDGTIGWNPSGYNWNGADYVTVNVA